MDEVKEWFTIKELMACGHTRAQLNAFCHSIHSRNMCYRTSTNGKWKIHKRKYEEWLMRNTV